MGVVEMSEFDGTRSPELPGMTCKNQTLRGFAVMPLLERERLRADSSTLFEMAARRDSRVQIGTVFPLGRAAEARRALEERRTVGKLALRRG
jgi:NADPH2:quinone reductase